MNVREVMNDNPQYVYIGVGVLFFFSMLLVVCRFVGGGGGSDYKIVYYNTDTKTIKIVEYSAGEFPVSPLEGEPNTYQATIYACSECDPAKIREGMTLAEIEEAGMQVRYIMKVDPEASQGDDMYEMSPYSYSSPDQIQWYTDGTNEMYELTEISTDDCPDATPCNPK